MPSLSERFEPILRQRKLDSLYRQRPLVTSTQQAKTQINGQTVINFSSNDYLGLANHPALLTNQISNGKSYGAGAAHLVTGHHLEHHLLEDELADWLGCERVLLFSTGYTANLAIQQTLMQKGDWILADKLNHASLIDGALCSEADVKRYPHSDMNALEKRLQQAQKQNIQSLIVTDGVFSMDGDLAPLPEIIALQKRYNTWLFVDDAHGFGTMGKNGKGTFEHFNCYADENTILMGTLGKAFGTFGAFVAGTNVLIETLIQLARPYIYTTAMPIANAMATRNALELIKTENALRIQLNKNIQRFKEEAKAIGLNIMPSDSPIQPIIIGEAELAIQWSKELASLGFWVSAIRPPTVPKNTARLRITLTAAHTPDQIDNLLEALNQVQKALPIPMK